MWKLTSTDFWRSYWLRSFLMAHSVHVHAAYLLFHQIHIMNDKKFSELQLWGTLNSQHTALVANISVLVTSEYSQMQGSVTDRQTDICTHTGVDSQCENQAIMAKAPSQIPSKLLSAVTTAFQPKFGYILGLKGPWNMAGRLGCSLVRLVVNPSLYNRGSVSPQFHSQTMTVDQLCGSAAGRCYWDAGLMSYISSSGFTKW